MGSSRFNTSYYGMGPNMKKIPKKELVKLKKQATQESEWEEVEGFKALRPTSIQLPPKVINDLEKIAHIRGEKSCENLLKYWVKERVDYEMKLIADLRAANPSL